MTSLLCGFCGSALPADQLVAGRSAHICRSCFGKALLATLADDAGPELPEADQPCSFCGSHTPASALYREREAAICASCLGRGYGLLARTRGLKKRRKTWKHLHQRTLDALVSDHFAPLDPTELVTSSRTFPSYHRVDLNRVLADVLGLSGCIGVHREWHETLTVAALIQTDERRHAAPLRSDEIDVGEDRPARCLETGLWLRSDPIPHLVLLSEALLDRQTSACHLEVAVPAGEPGEAVVRDLFGRIEEAVARSASYRGKVLSLERPRSSWGTGSAVTVHRLAPVPRDDVILPAPTLELLERNVFAFARHRPTLQRLGLPVKKGLLFYGPPGTGKTHTIRYLAGALPGHTTLLITAEQIGQLPQYMVLARLLAPSIVVIEDADLVGRQREQANSCDEILLNQLLNEMDGLRENTEILFVLTTNRPETLEAALVSRPGRIDQAIEFPLPDADGRRKLARLYGRGVVVPDATLEHVVERTEAVSAAFLKELMRRSTQFALERGAESLDPVDVTAALDELLFSGGRLNAALLGAVSRTGSP